MDKTTLENIAYHLLFLEENAYDRANTMKSWDKWWEDSRTKVLYDSIINHIEKED